MRNVRFLTAIISAATALAAATPASRAAGITEMLKATEAGPIGGPRVVMGTLINPHPVRQGQKVTCNVTSAGFGPNTCVISFDQVPAGHVLQIDKLQCDTGSTSPWFIFNTRVIVNPPYLVGILPAPVDTTGLTHDAGPYYFKAAESPRIVTVAGGPAQTAVCLMFGTLWQTK